MNPVPSIDTRPSTSRELRKRAQLLEHILGLLVSTRLAELPANEWRNQLKSFLEDPRTAKEFAIGDIQYARDQILAAEDLWTGRALVCTELYAISRATPSAPAWRTSAPALLAAAIVLAVVVPIFYWTTEITRRGDAAAYAAWRSYRDQHCTQISVTVVPRTDQVVNVYRCDGYTAWIADKGSVPGELAGKFRAAREDAMCRARADVLPWRPGCLGPAGTP